MAKRILVIPDVHGRTFWKEPVSKHMDDVDKVVFLGDYLDPYPHEGVEYTATSLLDNLMEIIDLKRHHAEKVVLLKGNHDQHYASEKFYKLACGSRYDDVNRDTFHEVFSNYSEYFKIAHLEEVNEIPYLFSHAGLTLYWIHEVNSHIWKMADNLVSIADQEIVEKINALDDCGEGQEMLAIVGRKRSWFGEKSGSVLWADVGEHAIPDAPEAYGLNKVFQVFGHTRLDGGTEDLFEFDNFAMIDSQKCFMIDESANERIVPVR